MIRFVLSHLINPTRLGAFVSVKKVTRKKNCFCDNEAWECQWEILNCFIMLLYFNPKTEFKLYIEIPLEIRNLIFTDIYVPVCNSNMLVRESLGGSGQRLFLLRDRALATVKRGREHTMPQPLFLCLCNDSGSICC